MVNVDEFLHHFPGWLCIRCHPALTTGIAQTQVRLPPRILEALEWVVPELDAVPAIHYNNERLAPRSHAHAKGGQGLVPVRNSHLGRRELLDGYVCEPRARHNVLTANNWALIGHSNRRNGEPRSGAKCTSRQGKRAVDQRTMDEMA